MTRKFGLRPGWVDAKLTLRDVLKLGSKLDQYLLLGSNAHPAAGFTYYLPRRGLVFEVS